MIASNALRKGNCVQVYGETSYVSQILWNRVEVYTTTNGITTYEEANYDDLEPIPVTPHWVMKFGWIRHERFPHRDVFHSQKGDFIINLLKDSIELSFGLNGNFSLIYNRSLYIHQVQNIYFALTNEELDINS